MAAERFDPVFTDDVIVQFGQGQTAAELDFSLIDQTAESQGCGLLDPRKTGLLRHHPVELEGVITPLERDSMNSSPTVMETLRNVTIMARQRPLRGQTPCGVTRGAPHIS